MCTSTGFHTVERGIDFRPNVFQHATPSLYKPSGDVETTRSKLDHSFIIHYMYMSLIPWSLYTQYITCPWSHDHCILNTLHVPDHWITVYSIHFMSLITWSLYTQYITCSWSHDHCILSACSYTLCHTCILNTLCHTTFV